MNASAKHTLTAQGSERNIQRIVFCFCEYFEVGDEEETLILAYL